MFVAAVANIVNVGGLTFQVSVVAACAVVVVVVAIAVVYVGC